MIIIRKLLSFEIELGWGNIMGKNSTIIIHYFFGYAGIWDIFVVVRDDLFLACLFLVNMIWFFFFHIWLSHILFEIGVLRVLICFFLGRITVDNTEKGYWFRANIFEMIWVDDLWVRKRKFEILVLEVGSTNIVDVWERFF